MGKSGKNMAKALRLIEALMILDTAHEITVDVPDDGCFVSCDRFVKKGERFQIEDSEGFPNPDCYFRHVSND